MSLDHRTQREKQDIATLWTAAVDEYNRNEEEDPKKKKRKEKEKEKVERLTIKPGGQVEDVQKATAKIMEKAAEDDSESILKFRNPNNHWDKARSKLWDVIKVVNLAMSPIAGLVACAYPPASAIAQALLFIYTAAAKVSEKGEQIATFYQTIQFFFERLALLENRLPQEHAFGEPLTRVFIAILNMCNHARKCVREGRTISFLRELVGKDDGLAAAYGQFTQRMNDLESSVLVATLGTVTASHRDLLNGQENMMGVLNEVRRAIRAHYALPTQTRAQSIQGGERRIYPMEQQGDGLWITPPELDLDSRTFDAFEYVLRWLTTPAEVAQREWLRHVERAFIPGIFSWIQRHPTWTQWKESKYEQPGLVIRGNPGTGKSTLALYMLRLLKHRLSSEQSAKTFTVYFNFSAETERPWSVQEMLCSCALQVAEEDDEYRQDLIHIMKRPCGKCPPQDQCDRRCWESLFGSGFYSADSGHKLFVVLDGSDQMKQHESEKLQELINKALSLTTFRFILTDKIEVNPNLPGSNQWSTITLEGENLQMDLQVFAKERLPDLPRLGRRGESSRNKIVGAVCEKADSFLYVDLMLYQLNAAKGKVKADSATFPVTVYEIYETLFKETLSGRNSREIVQIHGLFTWLCWAEDRFTLGAAERLIGLVAAWPELEQSESGLSIETEVDGRLSRLLILSPNFARVDGLDEDIGEDVDDEGSTSWLRLCSPSLRAFYKDHGDRLYAERTSAKYNPRIMMFRMITNILTIKEQSNPADEELVSFASKFWLDYLHLNGSSRLTQDEKETMVNCLETIFINKENAFKRLESTVNTSKPELCPLFGDRGLKILNKWLKLKKTLTPGGQPQDIIPTTFIPFYPVSGLMFAAAIHVNSWWSASSPMEAYRSFRLAHHALLGAGKDGPDIGGTIGDLDRDITGQIKLVSEAFEKWSEKDGLFTSKQFRCRSMALRYDMQYKEAVEDIKKGIKVCDKAKEEGDSEHGKGYIADCDLEKFRLLDRKGRTLFGWSEDKEDDAGSTTERNSEMRTLLKRALKAFQGALKQQPQYSDLKDWERPLKRTHQLKAKTEALLDRFDDCLETVKMATKHEGMEKKPRRALVYFDDIVLVMAEKGDVGWDKIIALLDRVSTKQLVMGCTAKTHELLQCAASKTEKHDRLEKMYKAVKTLQENDQPLPVNSILVWYAVFARQVQKDRKKAMEYLDRAMKPVVAGDIRAIIPASRQLTNILLDEFWDSEGSATEILSNREAVRGKMERLVQIITTQIPEFKLELSSISIPLAIMHDELGSRAVFKEGTDAIFNGCCKTLRDDLASNDPPSLRMLAKVLAVIPGLKEEARIAFSCQFYIIDKKRHDAEVENGGGEGSELGEDPGDGDRTAQRRHAQVSRRRRSHFPSRSSQPSRANEPESPIPSHRAWLIECSGSCRELINADNFKAKGAFLCLFCTNTILCRGCYDKRKGDQRDWRVRCASYHPHIEALVDGWQEVNDVILCARGPQKDKAFRGWLDGLEKSWEEKWQDMLDPTKNRKERSDV